MSPYDPVARTICHRVRAAQSENRRLQDTIAALPNPKQGEATETAANSW